MSLFFKNNNVKGKKPKPKQSVVGPKDFQKQYHKDNNTFWYF